MGKTTTIVAYTNSILAEACKTHAHIERCTRVSLSPVGPAARLIAHNKYMQSAKVAASLK